MTFLLVVLLMPFVIGYMVHWMLKKNLEDDKARPNPQAMKVRFFKLRKPTLVLCHNHLDTLKKGQVALVSNNNCKVCLDKHSQL